VRVEGGGGSRARKEEEVSSIFFLKNLPLSLSPSPPPPSFQERNKKTHLEEVDAPGRVHVQREQVLPLPRAVPLQQARERRRRGPLSRAGAGRRRRRDPVPWPVARRGGHAVRREQARGEVEPGLLQGERGGGGGRKSGRKRERERETRRR